MKKLSGVVLNSETNRSIYYLKCVRSNKNKKIKIYE